MKFGFLSLCILATAACFVSFFLPQTKYWILHSRPNVEIPFERSNPPGWLKAEISREALDRAIKQKAYTLALGWFKGKYKTWINGQAHFESDFHGSNLITISLDEKLLQAPSLAVKVFLENPPERHIEGLMNLDQATGFYDAENLEAYYSFHSFWARVRPFAYFLLNFTIALFFFTAWLFFPAKPEHFFLSLFALANALSQIRFIDFVFLNMDYESFFKFSFLAKCFIGASAALLGGSIGRIRESIMRWSALAMFGAPAAATLLFADESNARAFQAIGFSIVIPFFLSLGSLAVLSQAVLLLKRFGYRNLVKPRMRTLLFSSLGLLWLAYLFRHHPNIESESLASNFKILSHMAAHIGIVISWALMLLQELKKQPLLIEKTPVSEYHARPVLPLSLTGAVLTVDLKSSESLAKLNSADSPGENWLGLWRSHAYLAIAESNGVVLQKKGTEIQIFFDGERHQSAALTGFKMFEALVTVSQKLEVAIPMNNYLNEREFRLSLRGSLALGKIRPYWDHLGKNTREPSWSPAEGSEVFAEAARLLEAEKSLVPDITANAIAMSGKTASQVESHAAHGEGTWLRSIKAAAKNSPLSDVRIFLPKGGDASSSSGNGAQKTI